MVELYDAHTHVITPADGVTSVCVADPTENFQLGLVPTQNYCVGIHPWNAEHINIAKALQTLETLTLQQNVVAIGETGLDKHVNNVLLEKQQQLFAQQILLSERVQKPLVIHCVRAFAEVLQLKNELLPKQQWILHGFNRNVNIVKSLLDHDFVVSVGVAILQNQETLNEAVKFVPLQKLLLETDVTPYSNQRNVLQEVYQHVAQLHNITVEELCLIQKQTFEAVFNPQQTQVGRREHGS